VATRYEIRGIEPPDLYRFPDDVRKLFWEWVVELGIKAKAKDVLAGLDKDGTPLKGIKAKTRKNRKSAMTPSGKGDPSAPPLIPGWQKSRTYSLLYGTAFTDHAEFGWRYDSWTGKNWGKILAYQAQRGRDTIGLSPDGIARVKVQAWSKWSRWKAGTLKEAAKAPAASPPAVVGVGRAPTADSTWGIGSAGPPTGNWSGGMTQKEWDAYFRGQAKASLPGRPSNPRSRSPISGGGYNRLLSHVWGQPSSGSRPGRGPGSAAPVPARPRPTRPMAAQAKAPVPAMAAPIPPLTPKVAPFQHIGPRPSELIKTTNAGTNKADVEHALGAIDKLHAVPHTLAGIPVDTDAGGGNQGQFVYSAMGAPQKIGIIAGAHHPAETFTHEFAHYIEGFAIPGGNSGQRHWDGQLANPILDEWKAAIEKSQSFANLDAMAERAKGDKGFERTMEYLLRWDELWARSYSQWVATRSRDPKLIAGIDYYRTMPGNLTKNTMWQDNDFEPIAQAIDSIFHKLRWLVAP